jgi:exopolysaccharide biosynthesis polyprenyl glycosylphosphotransferase
MSEQFSSHSRKPSGTHLEINQHVIRDGNHILREEVFLKALSLERKRTERSRRRFVLMLLESTALVKDRGDGRSLSAVFSVLCRSTRETDITGWYKQNRVVGVIFTEIGEAEGKIVANALLSRVTDALCASLSIEEINAIRLSFHVFPEDSRSSDDDSPMDRPLYADLQPESDRKKSARALKRLIDISGSLVGLALLSPVLLVVAAAVKLGSKGPVLFRQKRIGQYGKAFTFLKFRSMHTSNDPAIHREYVTRFIGGKVGAESEGRTVFKIVNDPRVTSVGRVLRRSSLDELPQLINVLKGDMSLVGPRPPVPYEYESYDTWHKRRLLSVRPGITGLWQVGGRSRLKFDEMVRLDLKYASTWSVWLDLKILIRTPMAVLSGDGAY